MPAIQRWGNSLAVRIPALVASELAVVEGTPIEVVARDGELVVRPVTRRKFKLKELLVNCKPSQLHGETDFGPDVGREVLP
ncbi:MAG: AbrB/MazE/SpoVT family DNA-binding domain-containing protein [Candidatus Saccharimonas sp.]|nr:AbrB/MazE/SpoVT family DNA-binding domain-containing protein [Planctomycetaceae bacterium]